jgi:hypothetical protein
MCFSITNGNPWLTVETRCVRSMVGNYKPLSNYACYKLWSEAGCICKGKIHATREHLIWNEFWRLCSLIFQENQQEKLPEEWTWRSRQYTSPCQLVWYLNVTNTECCSVRSENEVLSTFGCDCLSKVEDCDKFVSQSCVQRRSHCPSVWIC